MTRKAEEKSQKAMSLQTRSKPEKQLSKKCDNCGTKSPRDTSLVPCSEAEPLNAGPTVQPRSEKITAQAVGGISAQSNNKHCVFVLSMNGDPLTPTTPAKARKMLKGGVAKPCWSKFGTFGIQMLIKVGTKTPENTALGVDHGTKFDGYSVVCGEENAINIKLDLPDKKNIVRKVEQRRQMRRARRHRNCRRREARFDNRKRGEKWLAPSQKVVVDSRLKVMRELFRIYPISCVGFEDVCFNHSKYRWGQNFSTVEIGKARIREFFAGYGATVFDYKGYQTKEKRELYGYKKTKDKSADVFTAHCSDSLTLAADVAVGNYVVPNGVFIVVDDTYRPVRRKLHDLQPAKGGTRALHSCGGAVFGLRKGLLIGTKRGRVGQLCGEIRGAYRFRGTGNMSKKDQRNATRALAWVSTNFATRRPKPQFPAHINVSAPLRIVA